MEVDRDVDKTRLIDHHRSEQHELISCRRNDAENGGPERLTGRVEFLNEGMIAVDRGILGWPRIEIARIPQNAALYNVAIREDR